MRLLETDRYWWIYFMYVYAQSFCGWTVHNQYQLGAKICSPNAPANINFKPMSVLFADTPLLHPLHMSSFWFVYETDQMIPYKNNKNARRYYYPHQNKQKMLNIARVYMCFNVCCYFVSGILFRGKFMYCMTNMRDLNTRCFCAHVTSSVVSCENPNPIV